MTDGCINQVVSPCDKKRREFIQKSVACAIATAYPNQSQAFLGAILRFMFSGTIRRAATRQAGRIVAAALARPAGLTLLGGIGAASSVIWAGLGAVEVKRLFSEHEIDELWNRQPDVNVPLQGQYGTGGVDMEFSTNGVDFEEELLGFQARLLVLPHEALRQNDAPAHEAVVGQGVLHKGQARTLSKRLDLSSLGASKFVVMPRLMHVHHNQVGEEMEGASFGLASGAAIVNVYRT